MLLESSNPFLIAERFMISSLLGPILSGHIYNLIALNILPSAPVFIETGSFWSSSNFIFLLEEADMIG